MISTTTQSIFETGIHSSANFLKPIFDVNITLLIQYIVSAYFCSDRLGFIS